MSWVKLDDQFPSHPKMVLAGGDAAWLHVCALCYCGQHLTDGFLPKGMVGRLSDRKKPDQLAARLVEVGAWIDHGDQYEIHGFLEFNPSRERVLAERYAARERRAKGGRTSGDVRANAMNPDPTRPKDLEIPAATAAVAASDWEAWWKGYPQKRDKASARSAYYARRRAGVSHADLIAARDHYVAAEGASGFVKYGATFLRGKDGPWSEWVAGTPAPSSPPTLNNQAGHSRFADPARAVLGRGVDAAPTWDLDESGNAVARAVGER